MQAGAATGGTVWGFLTKLSTELPRDPAVALLSIYLKGTKSLSQRYLHPYVQNSQATETTYVSVNR